MLSQLFFSIVPNFGAVAAGCNHSFFGLVPWYQYLDVSVDSITKHCEVKSFVALNPDHPSSFLLIAIAVVDDLLRIAALVAVGFVIVGGIKYITSQGSPEGTRDAQSTVINALVGLVIAMFAATAVAFLGNRLGGP